MFLAVWRAEAVRCALPSFHTFILLAKSILRLVCPGGRRVTLQWPSSRKEAHVHRPTQHAFGVVWHCRSSHETTMLSCDGPPSRTPSMLEPRYLIYPDL
jgi:hypothetical protein